MHKVYGSLAFSQHMYIYCSARGLRAIYMSVCVFGPLPLLYCIHVDCHLLHDIWAIDSLKSFLVLSVVLVMPGWRRNWAQWWGNSSDGIHFKSACLPEEANALSMCLMLCINQFTFKWQVKEPRVIRATEFQSCEFISNKICSITKMYSILLRFFFTAGWLFCLSRFALNSFLLRSNSKALLISWLMWPLLYGIALKLYSNMPLKVTHHSLNSHCDSTISLI